MVDETAISHGCYAILIGAIGVKLPQILNIVSAGSVEGLSSMSFYIEVPLTITHCAYNYLQGNPFSSFGDAVAILVQNVILVFLLWTYMKPRPSVTTIVTVLAVFAVITGVSISLPPNLQPILPLCNLPLTLSSRVPQIIKNMRSRSTGSLSSITNFLFAAGALARIFTTIQEVGFDIPLLVNYAVGGLTSGILFLQILFYSGGVRSKMANKSE